MMYEEVVKCEDVIDLSSDEEELPGDDSPNEDTLDVAQQISHTSRHELLNEHNRSYEHERSCETQKAPAVSQVALNAHHIRGHGTLDKGEHVIKDEAGCLSEGYVQHCQFYAQSSHICNSFPTNIQQKQISKKFWKAGDYDPPVLHSRAPPSGVDHVRVHPKFLHSNATSHKWALGAIAELLDNAMDEVQNGATYVSIDAVQNPRDGNPMLLVQDDGGGMDPDCMRECMSLGYSRKTTKTTIGQYGNGFKTSTMRLGADVIVFTRCALNGHATETIGLLSYTFLRETGKEDIIVPMVDFELPSSSGTRNILLRATQDDWIQNLHMILQWSPYKTESELLNQFVDTGSHGTKIIVFNLWLNDDGELELDFDSDKKDIQLRGGIKSSRSDSLLRKFTNEHISNRLRHSLRAYSSVLYLRMPERFQIFLRGEPVQHSSIAADLKFPEHILYKPQVSNIVGEVSVITTIGFAKEAPMINVHGFNVYHKNRLIMPFWKVFHENSSRGKGVVGVLEANFMEPAHDKQDFERTPVLQRLEGRLKSMTIEYWNLHCDLIGYQPPKLASKATTKVTSTCNASPVYASIQNTTHQPGVFPLQPVIATGIPAHLLGAANSFSPHLSSFQHQNPMEFQVSFGASNGVAESTGIPPRGKESQGMRHYDLRPISLRNLGMAAPSTPPQPLSDAEMAAKHADTTSDGCSNLASSFQSECSGSSLHAHSGAINGRAYQNMVTQEELLGKRLAAETVSVLDPSPKRQEDMSGTVVPGSKGPSSQDTSDILNSSVEVEQLRIRCNQYLWEKRELELKVLKLQHELLQAQYKLQMYEETEDSLDSKVEPPD